MALIQRKISKKKQASLSLALIGIVVVTVSVGYFGLRDKTVEPPRPPIGTMTPDAVMLPKRSGIDALERINGLDTYQSFKKFGNWPLPTEPRGRSIPFVTPKEDPTR